MWRRIAQTVQPGQIPPNVGTYTGRGAVVPTATGGAVLPPGSPGAPALPGQPPNGAPSFPTPPIWVALAHQYADPVHAEFTVSATANNPTVLVERSSTYRNFLQMRHVDPTNASTAAIFVSFGLPANGNSVIRLAANVFILYDSVVPQGDIYAFADAGTPTLAIDYANIMLPDDPYNPPG